MSCTNFSHLALFVALASCALNEQPLVTLNPSTPDAGNPSRPPPSPPVVSVDAGGTSDAGAGPQVPDEVLPTGCTSGATRSCGPATARGVCKLGTRVCVDGVWGDCIGAVMPGERMCGDSADNDCDGRPDDEPDSLCECVPGTSEPCDTHPGLDGVGQCKAGERTCIGSADGKTSRWSECTGSVGPAEADSCSLKGDDANCDATPNGGCVCVEGEQIDCGPPSETGICKKGKSTCVNLEYGECVGAVLPEARNCASSADNDCDGLPDNTIDATCTCRIGATEACGDDTALDGVGICRAGTRTCVAVNGGASSRWGECVGAVDPQPRNCASSTDNDCNGLPDNTVDATCTCVVGAVALCDQHPGLDDIGRCRAGQQVCVASSSGSAFTACQGSVGPLAADSCTVAGDDSNCNGVPNDGCECVAGAGNAPCDSPTASRCNATGACVACSANADCAHLTGLGVCSAGVCVECLTDAQCTVGSACNPTTRTCEAVPTTVDAGD